MKFWILSRIKIHALEDCKDFLPDDLIEAIADGQSKVITNPQILDEIIGEYPNLKYHYTIETSEGICRKVNSL